MQSSNYESYDKSINLNAKQLWLFIFKNFIEGIKLETFTRNCVFKEAF